MQHEMIWKKVLNSKEDVKFDFSVGQKYRKLILIVWCVFGAFSFMTSGQLAFILIITGIIHFYYLKVGFAYAFTNTRVIIHTGVFSTSARSVNFDKITEVTVVEPFLSKLIADVGDLIIHTGNVTDSLVLKNIEKPYEVKKKLDSLRNI